MRKDWIEKLEKNRQIIENMNKQYGDVNRKNFKMDKTNGFGHYRDFQDAVEGDSQFDDEPPKGQKNGFFMTDVDHEEKRRKMKEEREKLKRLRGRSKGLKVAVNPEDYLQENISKRNSEA